MKTHELKKQQLTCHFIKRVISVGVHLMFCLLCVCVCVCVRACVRAFVCVCVCFNVYSRFVMKTDSLSLWVIVGSCSEKFRLIVVCSITQKLIDLRNADLTACILRTVKPV